MNRNFGFCQGAGHLWMCFCFQLVIVKFRWIRWTKNSQSLPFIYVGYLTMFSLVIILACLCSRYHVRFDWLMLWHNYPCPRACKKKKSKSHTIINLLTSEVRCGLVSVWDFLVKSSISANKWLVTTRKYVQQMMKGKNLSYRSYASYFKVR